MSAITSIGSGTPYNLPFTNSYIHPGKPRAEVRKIEQIRKQQLDEALKYLSAFPKQVEKSVTCFPSCHNSVCYLAGYLVNKPWQIFKRAFLCCCCTEPKAPKPIPKGADETLTDTTIQFERNTCGVCCIAPAVIVAAPLIPAGSAIAALLQILSGIVITTTAGTNTYVFSGDIGVVPNGTKDLVVKGAIRATALDEIKDAYVQISQHLLEKWKNRSAAEEKQIGTLCQEIRDRWDDIVIGIKNCGLQEEIVEGILAPFSKALRTVLYEFEPEIKEAEVRETASLLSKPGLETVTPLSKAALEISIVAFSSPVKSPIVIT